MSLADIVNITISAETTTPSRTGFGIPLVLAYHTVFPERARSYTSVAAMITDGFGASDPAVRAATAEFAQNPRPTRVIVGRTALDTVMTVRITPPAALLANHDYTVYVNGLAATYTTDATPTVAEITAGLKIAIDALAQNVTTTDNTTSLDVVANTVPDAFQIYAAEFNRLDMNDNTTDGGIVTDLTAIRLENDDWYSVQPTNLGKAVIEALAAHVETLTRIMVVSTIDSDTFDSGSSSDVASNLQTAAYARSAIQYHPKANVQYGGCRWTGKMLPKDPGSATWKFKTLAGLDAVALSDTQVGVLEGKNCNTYVEIAGVNITQQGVTASGAFIDVTRGIDWTAVRMQERIFGSLANADKIPYTDTGVGVVEADVRAVLDEGIGNGLFAADPAPTVTVPKVADVSTADKANRLLPDVEFNATLAGAIHAVQIAGVVQV